MSRAFLSESDEDFMDDDIPEAKYPLPEGVKNYMTYEGAEKIKNELTVLMNTERPKIAARLSTSVTDEGGPQKESMLKDRKHLREIDRRIQYLTKMVENLEVVEPKNQDPNRVLFGATATVLENNEREKVYRIVGIDESNPSEGILSWFSPIARALTSKRVGDVVTLKIPAGEVKLKIIKIEYY
jgi:transcription elongation factor GreB